MYIQKAIGRKFSLEIECGIRLLDLCYSGVSEELQLSIQLVSPQL